MGLIILVINKLAAGGMVGITTGPGAVITSAAGGLIFGVTGYFGASWVADYIDYIDE